MPIPRSAQLTMGLAGLVRDLQPVIEPVVSAFLRATPKAIIGEDLAARAAVGKVFPRGTIGPVTDQMFKEELTKTYRELSLSRLRSYFDHEQYGTARKALAWGGAGLITANILGMDPLGATTAGNFIAKAGFHYLVGRTIGASNLPHANLLGMGYLGLAGYNAIRPGNQWGPF